MVRTDRDGEPCGQFYDKSVEG